MASKPIPNSIVTSIFENILRRPNVSVTATQAPKIAEEMAEEMATIPSAAVVPVQPAVKSKTNILNSAFIVAILGYLGINIPETPEQWATGVVTLAVPVLTIIFRTWFSGSVTPSSVGKK